MRDISPIIGFHQLLLLLRPLNIQIDDDELHAILVLLIEVHRAARLTLGIKASLPIENDVIRFPCNGRLLHVVSANEWPILAVARIVESRIQAKVLAGDE